MRSQTLVALALLPDVTRRRHATVMMMATIVMMIRKNSDRDRTVKTIK